jgi:hypothetical protein
MNIDIIIFLNFQLYNQSYTTSGFLCTAPRGSTLIMLTCTNVSLQSPGRLIGASSNRYGTMWLISKDVRVRYELPVRRLNRRCFDAGLCQSLSNDPSMCRMEW